MAGATLWRTLGYTLLGISVVTAGTGFAGEATGRRFVIPFWGYLAIAYGSVLLALVVREAQHRTEADGLRQAITAKDAGTQARFNAVRYCLQPFQFGARVGQFQDDDASLQSGYGFTVIFSNVGKDPIEYEVKSIQITVGSYESPPAKSYSPLGGIILPGSPQGFTYRNIPAPLPNAGSLPPRGEGEYSVIYGHAAGGPRFRMRHHFRVGWMLNDGRLSAGWENIERVTDEPVST